MVPVLKLVPNVHFASHVASKRARTKTFQLPSIRFLNKDYDIPIKGSWKVQVEVYDGLTKRS